MSLVLVIFEALMGMTISYYPYRPHPPATIMEAASSRKTLIFMLTGIGFLVPVMLVYNGYQYFVFSGKGRMKMAMPVSRIKKIGVKIILPCPFCAISPQRLTGSLAPCPLPP
jgi:hypothetical protein